MGYDTYAELWKRVLLRAPKCAPLLAQDFIRNSFRRISERRLWSYLIGYQQLIFHDEVTAGTVTVTFGLNTVTGNATAAAAWSSALIGRQFRIGTSSPILDIINVTTVVNPNDTLTLGDVWGSTTAAGVGYEIYDAYLTVPTDFKSFQSVYDPAYNFQLWTNRYTQADLTAWDAQRANAGNPYAVIFRDYDPTGVTSPPCARYEVWPHRKSQYVLPYLYVKQATDLSDSGATLPRIIRGDVVVEGALADLATWPGPDADNKNPYYSVLNARDHQARFDQMVGELERQDDELFEQDIRYQTMTGAMFPSDAKFYQSHLLGGIQTAAGSVY